MTIISHVPKIGDGQQPGYYSLPLLSFDPGGVSEASTCCRLHWYTNISELNLKPQRSIGCYFFLNLKLEAR